MKKTIFATGVLLGATLHAANSTPAAAQNGTTGEGQFASQTVDAWTIGLVGDGSICLAATDIGTQTLNYAILVEDGTKFMEFADKKFAWLAEGENYDVTLTIGNASLTVKLTASQREATKGSKGFLIKIDSGVTDLLKRSSDYSIKIDGTTYGPFSLKGSAKAINIASDCHAQTLAGKTAPESATLKLAGNKMHSFETSSGNQTFELDDWTVRFAITEGTVADSAYASNYNVTVTNPEGSTKAFEDILLDEFGLFTFQGGYKALVTSGYTGGSHCCNSVTFIHGNGSLLDSYFMGMYDNSGRMMDVDGSGEYVLWVTDGRFNYGFSSYAGSLPPPNLMTLTSEGHVNVSTSERNRPFILEALKTNTEACIPTLVNDTKTDATGACSGLLAQLARLELYESAADLFNLSDFDRDTGDPFEICLNNNCSDKLKTTSFKEALEAGMTSWGYLSRTESKPEVLAHFASAITKRGYDLADTQEEFCDGESKSLTNFQIKDGATPVIALRGYDYECNFQDMNLKGSVASVTALCRFESEPLEVVNYEFKLKHRTFFMRSEGQSEFHQYKACD